jgi:hypothetical protein
MKEEILNNGIEATENKQVNKASLYFGLLVITSLATIIFLGISIRLSIVNEQLEYQIKRRDVIIRQMDATNQELTYDNLTLSFKK